MDIKDMVGKIFNEDCLETMARMDDKSVDLILTDPPYAVNLEYDEYEDSQENWKAMMKEVIPEMKRVAKMVIMPTCQVKFLEWIYNNVPPDWLIIWYKGSTGHKAYVGFNDYEPHLVYGKTYSNLSMHDFFQTVASPKKGEYGHPCPKPIQWSDWLVLRATKEGDIVYDPFIGSGTTAVSCEKHNRLWLGSDISEEYCEIAKERVDKWKNQRRVFDFGDEDG